MDKLINLKVKEYINEVDSPSSAPGGGSVMGVVACLSSALAGMVGHLTINKKKFLELNEEEQNNFNNSIEQIKNIKINLMEIVDKDAESFNLFMEAMKMPKDTEEQIKNRKDAMSNAAIKAIEPPFNTLKYCYELITLFDIVLKYGNKGVITDIASAYILAFAAAKGSILNININIPMINDDNILKKIKTDSVKYIETIENRYLSIEKEISLFNIWYNNKKYFIMLYKLLLLLYNYKVYEQNSNFVFSYWYFIYSMIIFANNKGL